METIPAIRQAFKVAQQSKLSRKELEILEKREMFLHDSRNAVLKGIQQGIQQGLEQGRQEGLEEGRRQQAIAIARQLLNVLDDEMICQTTGLSLADIQQLKRSS